MPSAICKNFLDYLSIIGEPKAVQEKKAQVIRLILQKYQDGLLRSPSEKSKELKESLADPSLALDQKWQAILTFIDLPEKKGRLYKTIESVFYRLFPGQIKFFYSTHLFWKNAKSYTSGFFEIVRNKPATALLTPLVATIGIIATTLNSDSRDPLNDDIYLQIVYEIEKIKTAPEHLQEEFIKHITNDIKGIHSFSSARLFSSIGRASLITDTKIADILVYLWAQDDEGFFINNGKDTFWKIVESKQTIDQENKQSIIATYAHH